MLSAVLALIGAVVYGSADFLGGLAARRLRSLVVTAVAAGAGLVALLVALPFLGGAWTAADVGWGALAGVFGVIAIVLLYACLAIGPMSILSPLTAVVSAIAPMVWGLTIGGETLSTWGYAGLGVALVAVVLVGFIPGEQTVRPSARGLTMAVGSGLAIGGLLITLDQTSEASGIVPLIASRATTTAITGTAIAVLVVVALTRGRRAASVLDAAGWSAGGTPSGHVDVEHAARTSAPAATTRWNAWLLALGGGVLDAAANAMMLVALRLGDLSVVSALTALYPAGTILLAALVLRERVAAVQWVGLALALTAGVLLGIG